MPRVPLAWTVHYGRNVQLVGWPGAADRIEVDGDIAGFDATVRCYDGDDLVGAVCLEPPGGLAAAHRDRANTRSRGGRMTETYAQASRSLLRNSLLDGLRGLLLERDWSAVRMSDVAAAAGVSRQTVYNEFGTRATALRRRTPNVWPPNLAAIVGAALDTHPGDIPGALRASRCSSPTSPSIR